MKALRSILTVAAVAALVLCIAAGADAQGKKKKKGGRGTFGIVVKCDLKDDGTGSITVKTRGSKKKKTEGKELTFKITKTTKVLKGQRGKKGKKGKAEAARASDIKPRSFVIISVDPDASDTAARITIFNFGKKKKKKDAL